MVRQCFSLFWQYRRLFIIIVTPLVLIPLPQMYGTSESKCGYVLILVAIYWITEVLPMYVTALIPAFLVPLFGIMKARDIATAYFKENTLLLIGALVVGSVVEYRNLHTRIALKVLMRMGANPKMLILGFMIPTWLLSMWISNTATTAMMLPIVEAVYKELITTKTFQADNEKLVMNKNAKVEDLTNSNIETSITVDNPRALENVENEAVEEDTPHSVNLAKVLNICVAYAATCGGVATLTGTGTNVVFVSLLTQAYDESTGVNYGTWMMYAFPFSMINLALAWLWLVLYFLGPRSLLDFKTKSVEKEKVRLVLEQEYRKLGPMSFPEISSLVLLCTFIVLCMTQEPYKNVGWNVLFNSYGKGYIVTAQPALFVTFLVMLWPARNPFNRQDEIFKREGSGQLITWKEVQNRLPWGILLLIGGGMAMAKASNISGLSQLIGNSLSILGDMPLPILVYVITVGTALITEFTSNSATASIIIPIIFYLTSCINVNPLLISLPCIVGCSLAFCLPIATPPNAIVFARGYLKVMDMVKSGLILNFITTFVVTVATLTYGAAIFDLYTIPPWQKDVCNATESVYNLTVPN